MKDNTSDEVSRADLMIYPQNFWGGPKVAKYTKYIDFQKSARHKN